MATGIRGEFESIGSGLIISSPWRSLEGDAGWCDDKVHQNIFDSSGGHHGNPCVHSVGADIVLGIVPGVADHTELLNTLTVLNRGQHQGGLVNKQFSCRGIVLLEHQTVGDVDDLPLDLDQHPSHLDKIAECIHIDLLNDVQMLDILIRTKEET